MLELRKQYHLYNPLRWRDFFMSSEWPPGMKIFEIINTVTGPERVIVMIGAVDEKTRFLTYEQYWEDDLIEKHQVGLSDDLPIAELIRQTEEAAQNDASASGGQCE